jgi:ferric-dicitrate binding protein FerR (iron transport regulator)
MRRRSDQAQGSEEPVSRGRRRFLGGALALTLAGAAAATVRHVRQGGQADGDDGDPPLRPFTGKTRWIGHC